MAVKIRFTRIGKRHAPIYRIVAIDSRKKRDGKCLENLGTYNPMTKELIQYHSDRINYWISVGAIVTDSVARIIKIQQKKMNIAKPVAKKTVEAGSVESKPKAVKKPKAKVKESDKNEKSAEKDSSETKTTKAKPKAADKK